jgi:hypothetical protein
MNLTAVLIAATTGGVAWHVGATILIARLLQKRNLKGNSLLLRHLIPNSVPEYRRITYRESGRVGPLFFHWVVSINLALASVLLFALTR